MLPFPPPPRPRPPRRRRWRRRRSSPSSPPVAAAVVLVSLLLVLPLALSLAPLRGAAARGAAAFPPSSRPPSSASTTRRPFAFVGSEFVRGHSSRTTRTGEVSREPLATSRTRTAAAAAEGRADDDDDPRRFPRKRERRRRNGEPPRSRSRALLDSFERTRSPDLLASAARGLLDDDDGGGEDRPRTDRPRRRRRPTSLARRLVPRDASSLVRLLGRRGALGPMVEVCRRYCRDVVDDASTIGTEAAREDAEDAVRHAYAAAIAACARPPRSSSPPPLSGGSGGDGDGGGGGGSRYRSREFLLSLLDEMECGCSEGKGAEKEGGGEGGEEGRSIRPNSFVLSAVLLGIDDADDALGVLGEFERRYGKKDATGEEPGKSGNGTALEGPQGSAGGPRIDSNPSAEEGAEELVLTVHVYNAAISACARDPRGRGWTRALNLLRRMRRDGPRPDARTYALATEACARGGKTKVAISLLDEVRRRSKARTTSPAADDEEGEEEGAIVPSGGLYLPLLRACAERGEREAIEYLLRAMKEDSLEVVTEATNLYLKALARAGLHRKALEVLEGMIVAAESAEDAASARSAAPPDVVSCNTVLAALADAGDYDAARSLLDRMIDGSIAVRPDIISYNSLISCAPDAEAALDIVLEVRLTRRTRAGAVMPNARTYATAASRCRRAARSGASDPATALEAALHLLDLARDDGGAVDGEADAAHVHSAAIWTAAEVGDHRTALRILREMQRGDRPPNGVCYDGVVAAFARRGMHREALCAYFEMKAAGSAASRTTYRELARAIDSSPDLVAPGDRAALLEGILAGMDEEDRRARTGGPLVASLVRNHGNATVALRSRGTRPKSHGGGGGGASYEAARRAFDSIVGPADDACLSAMLQVCASVDPARHEEAVALLHSSDVVDESLGPGLVSRRALSSAVVACARGDRWDEALNLVDLYGSRVDAGRSGGTASSGRSSTGMVSVAALNSIIRACGRGGRPDVAVRVLNDVRGKYGATPNEVSFRLAVVACNQAEHRDAKLRRRRRGRREAPSSSPPGLPERRWWECALSLYRRMKEEGIEPSLRTTSSVVSACEASGQWQRALGVLGSMPSFAPLLGDGRGTRGTDVHEEPVNLYCLNAAIGACEKGGAWVEALQLYERARSARGDEGGVRPNFVTVNSLLIALERANQLELAESIYKDAVREKIVSPWRRRQDNDGELKSMMDLHQFSAPMATIAVRCYVESILRERSKSTMTDAVFIVGKGKQSRETPVLMPTVLRLFREEFGIDATVDEKNAGRVRVAKVSIQNWKAAYTNNLPELG
ncbi:hypothetical protein ACHAWF_011506 [Thalassiosira exigua]